MFLFLSKFIPTLVYPVSLAAFLMIAAVLVKNRKWRRGLALGAIALVWLAGSRYVAGGLVKSLEWRHLPPDPIPQAEAIVILGGGTVPAEYPRQTVEVREQGDRVIYGAHLYREGLAPLVLVTGGRLPWSTAEASGAANMNEFLVFMGVPAGAIILEQESDNTYENALFTRRILEAEGINHILLVTSAMHMPRSVMLFEKQGFDVTPAPTDFTVTRTEVQKPFLETWPDFVIGLFPSAGNLLDTTLAMKEYLGIAVYWMRGWI